MNTQELMIGDWVQVQDAYTQAIYFCQITKLDPPFIYFNSELDCVGLSYDCIFPIPLTPEILEKNGFYYGHTANEEDTCEAVGCGYPEKGWCYGEGAGEIKVIFPNEADGGLIRIDDECYDRAIEFVFAEQVFVHELQHALRLCGVEKEINIRSGATEIV